MWMKVQQKREIDQRNQDRDREYAEVESLNFHAFDRLIELIARNAPKSMTDRCKDEAKNGVKSGRKT